MPGQIILVVDTNLFHECVNLENDDFPWADLGDFDAIRLVVPETVREELDRHKKDDRARLKRRALEVVAQFRRLLEANFDEASFAKPVRASRWNWTSPCQAGRTISSSI